MLLNFIKEWWDKRFSTKPKNPDVIVDRLRTYSITYSDENMLDLLKHKEVLDLLYTSYYIRNKDEIDPQERLEDYLVYRYLCRFELACYLYMFIDYNKMREIFTSNESAYIKVILPLVNKKCMDIAEVTCTGEDDGEFNVTVDTLTMAVIVNYYKSKFPKHFKNIYKDIANLVAIDQMFKHVMETVEHEVLKNTNIYIVNPLLTRNTKDVTIAGLLTTKCINMDYMTNSQYISQDDEQKVPHIFPMVTGTNLVLNNNTIEREKYTIEHAKEIANFIVKNREDFLTLELKIKDRYELESILSEYTLQKIIKNVFEIDCSKVAKDYLVDTIRLLYLAYSTKDHPIVLVSVDNIEINYLKHQLHLLNKYVDTKDLVILVPNVRDEPFKSPLDVFLDYSYIVSKDKEIIKLNNNNNKVNIKLTKQYEIMKNNPEYKDRLKWYDDEDVDTEYTNNITLDEYFNIDLINIKDNKAKDIVAGCKRVKNRKGFKRLSILLYGLSGNSKSAFSAYIAQRLKCKLITISASDILNKYVGESEHKTKELFSKLNKDTVVVIEEGDALIANRDGDTKTYNDSLTNEWLVNLERFEGILILTTNYKDNLDKAILRRFTLKLELLPLEESKYLKALKPYISKYKLQEDISLKENLYKLKGLRLGDIGNIENLILFYNINKVSTYLEKLQQEIQHRSIEENKSNLGFKP